MTLDPGRIAAELPAGVEVHRALASTQVRARQLARDGVPHGFAVLAELQDEGRGRLGRVWESPPGSAVLATVVVRPDLRAAEAPLLCLAAAVAAVQAIEATRSRPLGGRYGIKWPNDVLAPDGRKVAGILAESDPAPDGGLRYALLGVGLNVHDAPLLPTATCLDAIEGGYRDRTSLAVALVEAVIGWTEVLADDPSTVLGRWRRDQITLGRQVKVGEVVGEAVDIEPDGTLLVRDDAGVVRRVTTGDVEMIRTL